MKTLCIICQGVDEDSDVLGFFVDWIAEFSKNFDHVDVIAQYVGKYNLPSNVSVYSLGKEKRRSKFKQLLAFYSLAWRLFPQSVGIFAHMSPIFVPMAWPVAVIRRKRIILWYLHRSVTLRLKIALMLCYKIVTASKQSLPIKSPKIIETGHGINVSRFVTSRQPVLENSTVNILSVGRISRIKSFETLIGAVTVLKKRGINFKLTIAGRPIMPGDFSYETDIKKQVAENHLADQVEFAGLVPYHFIPAYFRRAKIFVNLTPTGGVDKVVLEAMVAGCLPLVSNKVFEQYFGSNASQLIFEHGNVIDLASKLENLVSLTSYEMGVITRTMLETVRQYHGIEATIKKISTLFT